MFLCVVRLSFVDGVRVVVVRLMVDFSTVAVSPLFTPLSSGHPITSIPSQFQLSQAFFEPDSI